MELTHPLFLILLIALPLLLVASRRTLAGLTPGQMRASVAVRALLLACLILALVGVRWRKASDAVAVLFAVDHSASVLPEARAKARAFIASSLAAQGANDTAGVIGFAGTPALWQPPMPRLALDAQWPDTTEPRRSDVGRALDFAGALLPTDVKRRVVLLSDGQDTEGGAGEAAQRLGAAGIEVFTVSLSNPDVPEVLVERVDVPQQLKTGEPFDLTAHLRSTVETKATVKLYQNQFLVEQREMVLKPGETLYTAPNLQAEGTFATYEVEVVPEKDTALENNRAQAVASLRGQPRVLIVDADDTKIRPLADALRKEKIDVEVRLASGMPRTIEDLQQYDLLMVSDVSALGLQRDQMELYRRWVQDFGGGFAMLGGENSFGVGGYYRTPVEQMLPVRMEHEDRQDVPGVALLIVLDRSGSMSAQVQGQTKMALANQGAVFALNVLQPKDYFGVLAVDVRAHTVAPLAQHGAKEPVAQKILTVTAGGGGIYVYTSMVEAFALLRDVPARIRHVILFSDAADAEEKSGGEMNDGAKGGGSSLDLASAMLSAKITTSVVALGQETDRDTSFLRQLAERGNGRFYLTSDATTLPQIFSTETMKVAQSSLVEEPFQAVPARTNPILTGIDWGQAPLLLGYNATKPKPTSEVLLATERGEPLLATWRYGLGHATAFTSDAKARWAAEWLNWPGYGKFWAQLVRATMRRGDRASFAIATREQGDRLSIEIDAVKPDGAFRNELPITINALKPDGTAQSVEATQDAPGHYRAEMALPEEGTTVLSVHSADMPDGGTTFGHTRPYPREFLGTGTNETLLRRIAEASHGTFDPAPRDVWARPAAEVPQRRDLTDFFLMAALALLPLDIWLRRRA